MRQGIILAAGLGTRLPEITVKTPKSLIRVNSKPILERNIDFMFEAGLERAILVLGYMKERFEYLQEKYGKRIILVENKEYASSNTVSSMNCASQFFTCDSFVTTADIYLKINPFEKYVADYSFYLLRPYLSFQKPDWVAMLDDENRFISVDTHSTEGFSYTGISFWKYQDLLYIKKKLQAIEWNDKHQRKQYWDELLLNDFDEIAVRARILESNDEVYEFDDMGDVEELKNSDHVLIEW